MIFKMNHIVNIKFIQILRKIQFKVLVFVRGVNKIITAKILQFSKIMIDKSIKINQLIYLQIELILINILAKIKLQKLMKIINQLQKLEKSELKRRKKLKKIS